MSAVWTWPEEGALFPEGLAPGPLDDAAMAEAGAGLASGLGRLKELACRLAGLPGGPGAAPARLFLFCGDHGVAEEGVSESAGCRETAEDILAGRAPVSLLAAEAGLELVPVDAGLRGDPLPGSLDLRLGEGTANIAHGPAMSPETCLEGLRKGVMLALESRDEGTRLLCAAQPGPDGGCSAAAVLSSLLGLPPAALVTGRSRSDQTHRTDVVRKALLVNAAVLHSGPAPDPLLTLACLGGFETVLAAGLVLGAAAAGLPVLLDGFAATAACAAALQLAPEAASCCFFAHASDGSGQAQALQKLAQAFPDPSWASPLLQLGLAAEDGTGAALAWPLLRSAAGLARRALAAREERSGGRP